MKKLILSAAVLAMTFVACDKEEDKTTPSPTPTPVPTVTDATGSEEVSKAISLLQATTGTNSSVVTDNVTKEVLKTIVAGKDTLKVKVDTNGLATTIIDGRLLIGKIQTDGSVKSTLVDGTQTFAHTVKADNSQILKETEIKKDSNNKEVTIITDRMINPDGSGTESIAADGIKIIDGTKAVDGSAVYSVYSNGVVIVKAIESANSTDGPDSFTDPLGNVIQKEAAFALLGAIPNFGLVTGGGDDKGSGDGSGTTNVPGPGAVNTDNTLKDGVKDHLLETRTAIAGTTQFMYGTIKGSVTDGITIQIKDALPTTQKTYNLTPLTPGDATVNIIITVDGSSWYPKNGSTTNGRVTITPNSDGSHTAMFTDIELVDNAFAVTKSKKFSGKFSVKHFAAISEYSLKTIGDTYKASVVNCTTQEFTGTSRVTLTASSVSDKNRSGSLSISVPVNQTSGNLTVNKENQLNPKAGEVYIAAYSFNSTGTKQLVNVGQSGVVEIAVKGKELRFDFWNVPTDNGGTNGTDVLTGSATCLLK